MTLKENLERLIAKEWGSTAYSYFADVMIGNDTVEKAMEDVLSFELEFEKDGGQWCAHGHDFINLQESHAGFGATKREAAEVYYKTVPAKDNKHEQ